MAGDGTQPAPGAQVDRVSHGICRTCVEEKLATLPPPPLVLAPQPVPVVAPA